MYELVRCLCGDILLHYTTEDGADDLYIVCDQGRIWKTDRCPSCQRVLSWGTITHIVLDLLAEIGEEVC